MTQTLTVVRQNELTMPAVDPKAIEEALMIGDLSKMSPAMRVQFYVGACQSIGLNPYTKPFDAIKGDDGAVSLYANKTCAEQLRRIYNVSLRTLSRERMDGLYVVTVLARIPNGREEEAIGAVPLEEPRGAWKTSQNGKRYFEQTKAANGAAIFDPLSGTALANALKKAETQAKRRATLGICGLGFADAESAMGEHVAFDQERGTFEQERLEPALLAEQRKPLTEHVADIWGDTDKPAIPSEDNGQPLSDQDAVVEAPPEEPQDDWIISAKETAAMLREAEMAGALQGKDVDVLKSLEELLNAPENFTPAQRIIRLTKAEKLQRESQI